MVIKELIVNTCSDCDNFMFCNLHNHRRPTTQICKLFDNKNYTRKILKGIAEEMRNDHITKEQIFDIVYKHLKEINNEQ